MAFLNFISDENKAALLINSEEIKFIQNERADPTIIIVTWKDNSENKLNFGTFEAVKQFIQALADVS